MPVQDLEERGLRPHGRKGHAGRRQRTAPTAANRASRVQVGAHAHTALLRVRCAQAHSPGWSA
jgi:hypothetical protein